MYLSITRDEDSFIDNLRIDKIKKDKRHYTKTDIGRYLLGIGIDVENGKYLKLDPAIDDFVSQLLNYTIELDGKKITMKKSKEQVYGMLIEKGLQHLKSD